MKSLKYWAVLAVALSACGRDDKHGESSQPESQCAGVTCPAAADKCHVAGSCDAAAGVCSAQTAVQCPARQTCDLSDGTCKVASLCASVTCPAAADACHVAGTCDAATGVCSAQAAVPCSAGETCDLSDGICKCTSVTNSVVVAAAEAVNPTTIQVAKGDGLTILASGSVDLSNANGGYITDPNGALQAVPPLGSWGIAGI